jgi:hypothetical protein
VAPIDFRLAPVSSPEWWLARLMHRLEARAAEMQVFDDYYEGHQPLAFASDKFREAFGSRFRAFSSNFMALVVDGTRERLEIQGFRFKDPKGDKDLWDIWQENDLDAGSQLAHTESLVKGTAYALVEPNGGTPQITVEDPLDCIVEHGPKNRRERVAALKRWVDPDGHLIIFVYLPEAIYKYRSDKPWPTPIPGWPAPSIMADVQTQLSDWGGLSRYEVPGEDWPLLNPLGVIPIIALPNRPRLKKGGSSEIAAVMSNQDAVNKYRADALVAAEFVAVPQRYAINLDLERDPDTGRPKEPFQSGTSRLWVVPPPDPDNPDPQPVQLGQFAAADLTPYLKAIQTEVGHIASISRTPYYYLLGEPQSIPPSGESLKSSEAGLVKKIGATSIHLGEGWEETMRVALLAMDDSRAELRTAATIWADPETRNEAARTESIIRQYEARVIDLETAQEMLGYSPEQIARMSEALRKAPPPPTTPAQPPAIPTA